MSSYFGVVVDQESLALLYYLFVSIASLLKSTMFHQIKNMKVPQSVISVPKFLNYHKNKIQTTKLTVVFLHSLSSESCCTWEGCRYGSGEARLVWTERLFSSSA